MLIVKKSRIANAGKGLFTTSPIRKGDIIVEYKGDNLTWEQCLKRYGENIHKACYLYYISPKNCIDSQYCLDELARYANDANGFQIVKGLKNNAEFANIKKKPFLKATRNIKANEEILCDYSGDYWAIMKEQMEHPALKKEKAKTKGKAKEKSKPNVKKKVSKQKK